MKTSIWLTFFLVAWLLTMMTLIKFSNDLDNLAARIKPLEYQANRSGGLPRIRGSTSIRGSSRAR